MTTMMLPRLAAERVLTVVDLDPVHQPGADHFVARAGFGDPPARRHAVAVAGPRRCRRPCHRPPRRALRPPRQPAPPTAARRARRAQRGRTGPARRTGGQPWSVQSLLDRAPHGARRVRPAGHGPARGRGADWPGWTACILAFMVPVERLVLRQASARCSPRFSWARRRGGFLTPGPRSDSSAAQATPRWRPSCCTPSP